MDDSEGDEYEPSGESEVGVGEETGSEDSDEDYTSIDEDESSGEERVCYSQPLCLCSEGAIYSQPLCLCSEGEDGFFYGTRGRKVDAIVSIPT